MIIKKLINKENHIIDLNSTDDDFNVLKAKECEKSSIQETILQKMFDFDYYSAESATLYQGLRH